MTSKFEIAFTETSDYSGPNDDVSGRVVGRVAFTRGMTPWVRIADESVMTVTLWNGDEVFSPESPSSWGLRRGLVGRLTLNGVVMCMGVVDRIDPAPFAFGERTTRVTFRWTKKQIANAEASIDIIRNETTDEILRRVIVPHGIPPNDDTVWRLGIAGSGELGTNTRLPDPDDYLDADTGFVTHPIVGHNLKVNTDGTVNMYNIMRDVMQAELGYLFVQGDGTWRMVNRTNWLLNETVDVTLDNTAQGGQYQTAEAAVVNRVVVTAEIPEEADTAQGEIWRLPTTLALGANETATFYPQLRVAGEWVGADDVPRPGGNDFIVSDGTATVNVTPRNASEMMVTITAGSVGATISTLILRGKQIDSNKVVVNASDEESIAERGLRSEQVALPVASSIQQAATIANLELHFRNQTQGVFTSVNLTRSLFGADIGDITGRELGDVVRVVDDHIEHDRNYRLVRMDVEVDTRTGDVRATWDLLPSPYGGWWVLGTSQLGIDTRII